MPAKVTKLVEDTPGPARQKVIVAMNPPEPQQWRTQIAMEVIPSARRLAASTCEPLATLATSRDLRERRSPMDSVSTMDADRPRSGTEHANGERSLESQVVAPASVDANGDRRKQFA